MEHLAEARLIEALWDGGALSVEEEHHLSLCADCRRQLATLTVLRDELNIAGQSNLSQAAEDRLVAIFALAGKEAAQSKPLQSLVGALVEWVQALPLWDSRQQALAAGVRGAANTSYRLLFGADGSEVELMVEPRNGMLRVVGEFMAPEHEGVSGQALIELVGAKNANWVLETESDASGRFALEKILPGTYSLTITPRHSPIMMIDALELT
jgi:hypothetical protein